MLRQSAVDHKVSRWISTFVRNEYGTYHVLPVLHELGLIPFAVHSGDRIGILWFAKTLADFEINDIAALPPLFCYNS
jgi:hypothetical protein